MAETKLRPIKWLEGVLHHITPSGKVTIYGPGDVISDPEHLAALGERRIQQLIDEKKAAPADSGAVVTGLPLSADEKVDAQRIVQETHDEDKSRYDMDKALHDNLVKTGAAPAARDIGAVRRPSEGSRVGPEGSGTGAGPIAGSGAGPINPQGTRA